jgi:hypothetical protein
MSTPDTLPQTQSPPEIITAKCDELLKAWSKNPRQRNPTENSVAHWILGGKFLNDLQIDAKQAEAIVKTLTEKIPHGLENWLKEQQELKFLVDRNQAQEFIYKAALKNTTEQT